MDEKPEKGCAKVTRNPFFNFLRCYRAQPNNRHKSAVQTAVEGAKVWKRLQPAQRTPFEEMAVPFLKPGVKRRARSTPARRPRRATRRTRSASRSRRRTRARTPARSKAGSTRRSRGRSRAKSPARRVARRTRSVAKRRARSLTTARRGRKLAARTVRRRGARARSRARSRSRSRAKSAPARRRQARRSRSRTRRSAPRQPVKLEYVTSPSSCELCPRAVTDPAQATEMPATEMPESKPAMETEPTSEPEATSTTLPPAAGMIQTGSISPECMGEDCPGRQELNRNVIVKESYDSPIDMDDCQESTGYRESASDKIVVGPRSETRSRHRHACCGSRNQLGSEKERRGKSHRASETSKRSRH